jgi:hypothetical protein
MFRLRRTVIPGKTRDQDNYGYLSGRHEPGNGCVRFAMKIFHGTFCVFGCDSRISRSAGASRSQQSLQHRL